MMRRLRDAWLVLRGRRTVEPEPTYCRWDKTGPHCDANNPDPTVMRCSGICRNSLLLN